MRVVLLPLDGSAAAVAALPLARYVAGLLAASVHALSVGPAPISPARLPARMGLTAAQAAGLVLEAATGDPAAAIVECAATLRAALIVMGLADVAEGDDPLRPVARAVLQTAPCPLVLVRAGVAPTAPVFQRILLPLDGTPSTAAAIAPAVELARRSGATLDVLFVAALHGERPAEPGSLTVPRYIDQPQLEWPAWSREFLDRFCPTAHQIPPTVRTRLHVAVGQPAAEICALARALGSDLIVLVWRGELRIPRAPTFRAVIAAAPCPVLAVRMGQAVPWATSTGRSAAASS